MRVLVSEPRAVAVTRTELRPVPVSECLSKVLRRVVLATLDPKVRDGAGLTGILQPKFLFAYDVRRVDVRVPGEVVKVTVRTGDHESSRICDRFPFTTASRCLTS